MTAYSIEKHSVEEKLNSLTHGIGAGLSIAGLVILLQKAAVEGSGPLTVVSFALYGAFQILLYTSSALTHQFSDMPRASRVFRIVDQAAIYLLIAGTYTPAVLLGIGGAWGWSLFGTIWGMALLGILSKTLFFREKHILSDLFYLPMGWLVIIAFKPMQAVMPRELIRWIIIGGVSYSVGIIFYLWKKLPMSHVIWHLFVLAGGIAFFMGFYLHL
ncbi:MAG: hemolysin III family protein [Spirochaetales bacterium]|nr:hemolysin III family protein [Spirochaetales bacterium]